MAYGDTPFPSGAQGDASDGTPVATQAAAPKIDPSLLAFLAKMTAGGQPVSAVTAPAIPRPDPNNSTGSSIPASAIPSGGNTLRIQNGQNIQDFLYTPNGSGVQATTMRDANTGSTFSRDPGTGQWYTGGSAPGTPGMGFDAAQAAVGGRLPTQDGLASQQLLKSLFPAEVNNAASRRWALDQVNSNQELNNKTMLARAQSQSLLQDLGLKQQQLDINRQLANDKNDPRSMQTQHAIQLLAQNPGLTIPQIMAQTAKLGQVMQSIGGTASQSAASLPTPGTLGAAPANAGTVERARMDRLGPEVYQFLNQPVTKGNGSDLASNALTNIYRYDQQHPGFMQQHGQEVMGLIKQNYGEPALNSFMDPGGISQFGSDLSGLFGGAPSDTEQARNAVRNFLGRRRAESVSGYLLRNALRMPPPQQ